MCASIGKKFATALLLLAFSLLATAAELAANVVFATGAVNIVTVDGSQRAALRGGDLFSGETVETGVGRVQLRFRDGAIVSLQPESRLRVDEYRFHGDDAAQDRGFFSLLKGGLRTVTGLLGKLRNEQYRVRTTYAVIGIRGTDYQAALGNHGLIVKTLIGVVEVCNDGGCVQVSAGETAQAIDFAQRPRLLSSSSPGPTIGATGAQILPQMPAPQIVSSPPLPQQSPAQPVTTPPDRKSVV